MKKSCCGGCKNGKTCGGDAPKSRLSDILHKSRGYGVYGYGVYGQTPTPVPAAPASAEPSLPFGLSKQTLTYAVMALLAYKILL